MKASEFLLGGMFLIFLTLKLLGVISWSWWWVTVPIWGCFALALVLFAIGLLLAIVRDIIR